MPFLKSIERRFLLKITHRERSFIQKQKNRIAFTIRFHIISAGLPGLPSTTPPKGSAQSRSFGILALQTSVNKKSRTFVQDFFISVGLPGLPSTTPPKRLRSGQASRPSNFRKQKVPNFRSGLFHFSWPTRART